MDPRRRGQCSHRHGRCWCGRAVRRGLPPACRGSVGHSRRVRITYGPAADAVYIHLTGGPLTPGPPPSRPAPRPASTHSSRSTGKTTGSPASKIPRPAAACTTTSPRKPKSSAGRAQGTPVRARPSQRQPDPWSNFPVPPPAAAPGGRNAASAKAGPQAPAGCLDAGEHRRALAQQARLAVTGLKAPTLGE